MLPSVGPALVWLAIAQVAPTATATEAKVSSAAYPPPGEVKAAFLKRLDRPRVPLDVKVESSARGQDGLIVERLSFASEKKADGSIERVPALVVRPDGEGRRPAVIVLHGTGGSKDGMRAWLDAIARRGMIGVAIDARYHGDRAGGARGAEAYNRAITRAWRAKPGEPQEHPFYYDTCVR